MINWDEEIESTKGHEMKLLDQCCVKNGLPYKLVKVPATYEGGSDELVLCRDNGSLFFKSDQSSFGSVRNKPKIVERWIVLWKAFPGAVYYNTEEEAKQAVIRNNADMCGRGDFIKIQKVEWEA